MDIVFEVIAVESLRVKLTGTLHSVAECALPDIAKGHVTFFTVSSLGSVDCFDP